MDKVVKELSGSQKRPADHHHADMHGWGSVVRDGRNKLCIPTGIMLLSLKTPLMIVQRIFHAPFERIVQGLNECGIPLCKGNVMATNPKFFGTMSQWKNRLECWIDNISFSEAELMDTYIFWISAVFTVINSLEKELRQYMNESIEKIPLF